MEIYIYIYYLTNESHEYDVLELIYFRHDEFLSTTGTFEKKKKLGVSDEDTLVNHQLSIFRLII